ncbi:MAG: hypothetical protein AB1598_01450 [Thermodesulfobacteriota bacterium]
MKQSTPKKRPIFLHVFGIPILLAALSAFGLVSALLGNGIWDMLSWITLGIPVAVIVRHVWFGGSRKNHINWLRMRR